MKKVELSEFQNNIDHYIELSNKEDIYIVKGNKILTILTSPSSKAMQDFLAFPDSVGSINENVDYDKIIKEEIIKRCSKNKK